MRTKSKTKDPEVILRNGIPAAVISDISEYKEMLERLQDVEDLEMLREMRRKPIRFRKLMESVRC